MRKWNLMEYYERFRNLREDHDLTQSEIAEHLGIRQNYYSLQERGLKPFQVEQIIKLCDYYKVSADYILGLEEGLTWPRKEKGSRGSTKYAFLYNKTDITILQRKTGLTACFLSLQPSSTPPYRKTL